MAGTIGSMPGVMFTAGTRVDVRSRYIGSWSRGFEVAERARNGGYKVRRLSDGAVLPDLFEEEELRPERRRSDFGL
jgi:hypothetical protein